MTKKLCLLFIIVVAAAFVGTLYFLDKTSVVATLTNIKTLATAKLQPIISWWNNLPFLYKSIALMGIPVLASIFFAWTKNLAINKLNQTEAEKTQLTGELTQISQQVSTLSTEKINLENQVQAYADGNTAIKNLSANLDEATRLVTNQQNIITAQQKQIAELTGKIEGMKTQITYEERIK